MHFQQRPLNFGGGKGGPGGMKTKGGYSGAPAASPQGFGPGGKGADRPRREDGGPIFQPKAFPWHGNRTEEAKENQKKLEEKSKDPNAPTRRVYEAVDKVTVRAEPSVTAKMKTKKSKGARVFCAEVTLNWWLKLDGEPGYLPLHLRGLDGQGEVAICVDDSVGTVAVENYHPQGICCLEVVFKAGAPIWEEPNRSSKAVATRRVGEYVFASAQNWDGWLRLATGEGWMQLVCPKAGELLKLRKTRDMDVWALSDIWDAARKTRKSSFGSKEVQALKDLERRVSMTLSSHLVEVQETGSVEKLLAEGLLKEEELNDAATRVRAKLFANILTRMVREEALFRELAPNFKLSAHIPPLPATEDEEEEEMEDDGGIGGDDMDPYSWYSQQGGRQPAEPEGGGLSQDDLQDTQPFVYDNKVYRMTPSGVLFDPPNEVPIGLWNAKSQKIEPAAGTMPGCPYTMLSYFGKSYVVMPDNAVIDPATEEVVGILNQETNQIDLIDPVNVAELADVGKGGAKGASKGAKSEPERPVLSGMAQQSMKDSIDKGDNLSDLGSFEEAAAAFGEALTACRRSRTIDLEEESSILRKRASCWAKLGRHKELLEDAEQLLSYNDEDEQADDWKRMATLELIRAKAERAQTAKDAKASAPMAKPSPAKVDSGYDTSWKPPAAAAGGPMSAPTRVSREPPQELPGMDEDKSCAYCGVEVDKPSACSKCRKTYYCGRTCQRNHWKVHKHECGKVVPARPKPAPAAVDEDGAGMEELD
mmetsp:Transcript_2515/g.5026  ORF Transcript_2515/g.5026 Transcript_2515/m.5026 type:complete len:760 (-) Transcript_2515:118-2397(-)